MRCLLLAAALTALPGLGLAAPASAPVSTSPGLHFVFDASASMCGYLGADGTNGVLLSLLRFATTQRDAERNRRVVLIRQLASRSSPNDLVEAPSNFQALAAGASGNGCAPFDGKDSQPSLVFETPRFAPKARSLILVSDMQLDERALVLFVDALRQWARALPVGEPHSVGIATFAAPYAGRYFATAEPDVARRNAGYVLPRHVRPLHMLWFLAGGDEVSTGRQLLSELGVIGPRPAESLLFGLQAMPNQTIDTSQWMNGTATVATAADLFEQPTYTVNMRSETRSADIVRRCVRRVSLAGNQLSASVDKACRDRIQFFDQTVIGLDVTLAVRDRTAFVVRAEPPPEKASESELMLRLVRQTPPVSLFKIDADVPVFALDRAAIRALSLDNDACASTPPAAAARASAPAMSWERRCALRLDGKAYRYDALIEQIASRTHAVLSERAKSLGIELRLVFDR